MARVGKIIVVIFVGILAFSASLMAGRVYAVMVSEPYHAFSMIELADENQLPLLGDRFRIDDNIEQITLLFFREPGSSPVVLILPDGSKWYSTRYPDSVEWESGPGFDQVRIEQPMRGPWQVSGAIQPESRLMVVSDLRFDAEALPPTIFQGERLRVRGSFTEAGQPIDQRDFRQAIEMQLYLLSTNDPDAENFGLNPRRLGEFVDDGRGLDARAGDGEFTGDVEFNVPQGMYIPSYRAHTPLYQRTFEQVPIRIAPLPVSLNVDVSTLKDEPHRLQLEVDQQVLRADDVVIRGQVEYPNGEIQRIEIQTAHGDSLRERIPNYTTGNFRINLRLYATTLDGREIEARFEPYEFMARQPQPAPPTEEQLAEQRALEREQAAELALQAERAQIQRERLILAAIIGINLVLILSWFGWLRWRSGRRN